MLVTIRNVLYFVKYFSLKTFEQSVFLFFTFNHGTIKKFLTFVTIRMRLFVHMLI